MGCAQSADGDQRGGATASFQYDAFGRRIAKTVDGTTTAFVYDAVNAIQEKQGGTPSANLMVGLGFDEFFRRVDGGGTASYLLPDANNNTIALANAAGAVATSYSYEPYGQTTYTGSANSNPYQYTGRENDGTGLYHYRARYYHPTLKRFIAEDPIGLAGGINIYAYVEGNPVSYVDPLGLEKWWYLFETPKSATGSTTEPPWTKKERCIVMCVAIGALGSWATTRDPRVVLLGGIVGGGVGAAACSLLYPDDK